MLLLFALCLLYPATVAIIALNCSCTADCSVSAIDPSWVWAPATISGTVTAATIVYIVNNRTNTTGTSTIYNSLPSQVTIPPTNSAGLQTAVITPEVGDNKSEIITL